MGFEIEDFISEVTVESCNEFGSLYFGFRVQDLRFGSYGSGFQRLDERFTISGRRFPN